jgi:hypothetical protein
MKSLQMNVRDFVEYNRAYVEPGTNEDPRPSFKCIECGSWTKDMKYWLSKKFNPDQEYQMVFLCGPKCATEKYERERGKDKANSI